MNEVCVSKKKKLEKLISWPNFAIYGDSWLLLPSEHFKFPLGFCHKKTDTHTHTGFENSFVSFINTEMFGKPT